MAIRARGIMGPMGRAGAVLLLLLAGCAHQKQLNLLEREKLEFRAENERIRAEDLEERYRQQKQKSDALAAELLTLQRDRDRLYGEYDMLRGETVRLERDVKASGERRDALAQSLAQAKAAVASMEAELEAEQKVVAQLEEQLRAAQAKHAELVTTEKAASE